MIFFLNKFGKDISMQVEKFTSMIEKNNTYHFNGRL